MKKITIGFLGCGGIGSGVWNLLQEMKEDIASRHGLSIEVKRILVRNVDAKRDADIPRDRLTTDPDDLLTDPKITMLMEFMGGEQPAVDYARRALRAGKTVITANKVAMALGWQSLFEAAKAGGAGLYFEAAVCAAIPIIRTMLSHLQGNKVKLDGHRQRRPITYCRNRKPVVILPTLAEARHSVSPNRIDK